MTGLVELPRSAEAWVGWLRERVDSSLATVTGLLAELKDGEVRTTDEVLELWNDADIALHNADVADQPVRRGASGRGGAHAGRGTRPGGQSHRHRPRAGS